MKSILFVLIILVRFCWAGDVAGNGGHVVVCKSSNGQLTYEFLDYFEGRMKIPPLLPDLGSESMSETERALVALDRLETLDSGRARAYRQEVKAFFSNVDWINQGPSLEFVSDTGPVSIPNHCHLEQLAIRRPTFHPSVKQFLVDQRLWDKLSDSTHRSGLILHEVVYGELIRLGHKTSFKARFYNMLLSSDAFSKIPLLEYENITQYVFTLEFTAQFKQDVFEFRVLEGKEYSVSLRDLLKHSIKRKLEWYLLPGFPSWVTMDRIGERLLIKAPNSESVLEFNFNLAVRDSESGAIAQIKLTVEKPPRAA